jgi:hypothetical protein
MASSTSSRGREPDYRRGHSSASTPSRSPSATSQTEMHHSLPYRNGYSDDLPPLQADTTNGDHLEPILEDDPRSFDLLQSAPDKPRQEYSLEKTSLSLFSKKHLQVIFADPAQLLKFTTFLGTHRPQSVPLLVHYLDSLKSLRVLHYANAITAGLDPVEGLPFTQQGVQPTINTALEARVNAFDVLVNEELPAFVTHQYIQIVTASISARITGALAPHLREASEGLAEVFCLTDPSRPDNPIVFASEGEHTRQRLGLD